MIEFQAGPSPASQAVSIMLEEAELEYTRAATPPDEPDSPQVLISGSDGEPASFSGVSTILKQLASQSDRFLSANDDAKCETLSWLRWAGDELAGAVHETAPSLPIDQLTRMETALQKQTYLVGDAVTIADFAAYPLIQPLRQTMAGQQDNPWPKLLDWIDRLSIRPALARGFAALS